MCIIFISQPQAIWYLSLLSWPRPERVPVHCPHSRSYHVARATGREQWLGRLVGSTTRPNIPTCKEKQHQLPSCLCSSTQRLPPRDSHDCQSRETIQRTHLTRKATLNHPQLPATTSHYARNNERFQLAPRHDNTTTRRRLQKKRQQRPHHQKPTHFLPQLHKTRNGGRVANTGGRREPFHLSRTKDVSETGSSTPKLQTSAQPERIASRRQRSRCTGQQGVQFATAAILDLERQLR